MKCINEKSLAHAAFVVALTLTVSSAFAIELVCKGHQPQARNQRVIQVDCADRKKVIDALSAAWMTLRKEKIGGIRDVSEELRTKYDSGLASMRLQIFSSIYIGTLIGT